MDIRKQGTAATADMVMLAVIVLVSILTGIVLGIGQGIGVLLGCFLWAAIVYGLVFGAYAVVGNRSRAPESRRFILITATIFALLGTLGMVINNQNDLKTSDQNGPDTLAAQQLAMQQKQQEIDAAKLQQQADERKQNDLYKAALVDTLGEMKKASNASNTSEELALLKEIDVTGCPPEFRKDFLDLVYDLDEVQEVDVARKQLSSDENVSKTFLTQVEQLLAKSSNSAVDDALTEDQQLVKARGIWLQHARAAEHNVQLTAANYGLNY